MGTRGFRVLNSLSNGEEVLEIGSLDILSNYSYFTTVDTKNRWEPNPGNGRQGLGRL